MLGKLKSKWLGHFIITNIPSFRVVKIKSLDTEKTLEVNKHRFKIYNEGEVIAYCSKMTLALPSYTWSLKEKHDQGNQT